MNLQKIRWWGIGIAVSLGAVGIGIILAIRYSGELRPESPRSIAHDDSRARASIQKNPSLVRVIELQPGQPIEEKIPDWARKYHLEWEPRDALVEIVLPDGETSNQRGDQSSHRDHKYNSGEFQFLTRSSAVRVAVSYW